MESLDSLPKRERREYLRVNVSFPVTCCALPYRKYFHTVSKDLSLGGIKILSHKFLYRGKYLRIEVNLIRKVATLKAKVIWCNKERRGERYISGLKFMEINKESYQSLSCFLNSALASL